MRAWNWSWLPTSVVVCISIFLVYPQAPLCILFFNSCAINCVNNHCKFRQQHLPCLASISNPNRKQDASFWISRFQSLRFNFKIERLFPLHLNNTLLFSFLLAHHCNYYKNWRRLFYWVITSCSVISWSPFLQTLKRLTMVVHIVNCSNFRIIHVQKLLFVFC